MKEWLKKRKTWFSSSQYRFIHSIKWNYLIILDACRYDFFVKEWTLNKVMKVQSPSSYTAEWMALTFPDYYECNVYSSNPFINSKGIGEWNYHAKDHFRKIVDLWDFCWDHDLGTVHPQSVFNYCRDAKAPSIIWFLQPHAPYLNKGSGKMLNIKTSKDFIDWRPSTEKETHWSDGEIRELHDSYRVNVQIVLKWVCKLIASLQAPIIVTSDHGELLGEYDQFGHPSLDVPELRIVPLVVVK